MHYVQALLSYIQSQGKGKEDYFEQSSLLIKAFALAIRYLPKNMIDRQTNWEKLPS
jgi:hypothetical protein